MLKQQTQAIGIFTDQKKASQAFDQLVIAGFPLARVFLLGPDQQKLNEIPVQGQEFLTASPPGTVAGTTVGLKKGFVLGNLFGGATGLLLGAGILALPGIGQVALGSAIAFLLGSGVVCTAAGGVIGSLVGLGLTEKQLKEYARQLQQGKYLLIMEGEPEEIKRARAVLSSQEVQR